METTDKKGGAAAEATKQCDRRAPLVSFMKMTFGNQKPPFLSLREPQGVLSRPLNNTPYVPKETLS